MPSNSSHAILMIKQAIIHFYTAVFHNCHSIYFPYCHHLRSCIQPPLSIQGPLRFNQLMSCNGKCKKRPEKTADTDDTDVWASDDEHVSPYADIQRAHVNQGYLDGITVTQELELQKGFDDAYPEGAQLGLRVGRILARLHGKAEFAQAKEELGISKVLDQKHFNEKLHMTEDHGVVRRWEQWLETQEKRGSES